MKSRIVISSCAAAILSLGVAAAQVQPQTPAQSPVPGSTQGIEGQSKPTTGVQGTASTTWTGCVMRAADYTKAHAGTNVGTSQFVLANAMTGAGAQASAAAAANRGEVAAGVSGSTSTGREAAVGTSGSAAAKGMAYGLSSAKTDELTPHVGKRVEVVGSVAGEAKAPAIQQIAITSVRVVPGTCE
jgi:hypothetical protein